jgi:hypothetical protein
MSVDLAALVSGLELKIKALEERINELARCNIDSLILMAPNTVCVTLGTEPTSAEWNSVRAVPSMLINGAGNCRSIWANNNAQNSFLPYSSNVKTRDDILTGIEEPCLSNPRENETCNEFTNDNTGTRVTNVIPDYSEPNVTHDGLTMPGRNICSLKSPGNILLPLSLRTGGMQDRSRSKITHGKVSIGSGLHMPGCTCRTLGAPGYLNESSRCEDVHGCILYTEALIKCIFKNHSKQLINGVIEGLVADKGFRDALIKELLFHSPKFVDYNALLNLAEIAVYLKVSLRTVKTLVKEEKLKVNYVGNKPKVWLSDLKQYFNLGLL